MDSLFALLGLLGLYMLSSVFMRFLILFFKEKERVCIWVSGELGRICEETGEGKCMIIIYCIKCLIKCFILINFFMQTGKRKKNHQYKPQKDVDFTPEVNTSFLSARDSMSTLFTGVKWIPL